MHKKLYERVKSTVMHKGKSKEISHETEVNRDRLSRGVNSKKKWLLDYQAERDKKRQYIRQHVTA